MMAKKLVGSNSLKSEVMQNSYIDDGLVYSWVLHYYPARQKRGRKPVRVFTVDATTPMFLRAKHTKPYRKPKTGTQYMHVSIQRTLSHTSTKKQEGNTANMNVSRITK